MVVLKRVTKVVGKRKRRVGRGYGCQAGGHTVGKGQKGQKSRGRGKTYFLFEGGRTPFYKKIPKYSGMKPSTKVKKAYVNLRDIERVFKANDTISLELLKKAGLVRKDIDKVKILAKGKVTKKYSFVGVGFSAAARKAVEAKGAQIKEEVISKVQKVNGKKQSANRKQQIAKNKQQAAKNKQKTATSKKKVANSKEQGAISKKQSATSKKPAARKAKKTK